MSLQRFLNPVCNWFAPVVYESKPKPEVCSFFSTTSNSKIILLWSCELLQLLKLMLIRGEKKKPYERKSHRWLNLYSPGVFLSLRHRNQKGKSELLFTADFHNQDTVYEYKLYPNEKWLSILMPIHLTWLVQRLGVSGELLLQAAFDTWDNFLSWITMLYIFLPYIC